MSAGRAAALLWALWALGGLAALISIRRSRVHSARAKTLWALIVLVPVLGPLGWFLLGRERSDKR